MSVQSKARNQKRPSPTGKRPRLRGEIQSSRPAIYLRQFQNRRHLENAGFGGPAPKTSGAFGGVTRIARKIREDDKAVHAAEVQKYSIPYRARSLVESIMNFGRKK